MQAESCVHSWELANVKPCFIITETCFKCKKIANYFSFEERPHIEEYKDGDHFWNVIGHSQSIRFDLHCTRCDKLVRLEELAGLMMCTSCDESCKVYSLMKKLEQERTWVYVAFGFLPRNERKQVNEEQIKALEEYFNQRRKSSKSRIKIISSDLIDNFNLCYGDIIKDVGLLSSKPPEY